MSQTKKVSKVQIRNNPEAAGRISTGANTQLFIDGNRIDGVSFFKYEVKAGKVPKLLIEMYAEVEIDADLEVDKTRMQNTQFVNLQGQPFSVWHIGSLHPFANAIDEIKYFERTASKTTEGKLYFFHPDEHKQWIEAPIDVAERHALWVKDLSQR